MNNRGVYKVNAGGTDWRFLVERTVG